MSAKAILDKRDKFSAFLEVILFLMLAIMPALLMQGCVVQFPSMRAMPITEALPKQVAGNEGSNIICVDTRDTDCMECDAGGGNCHFPVFKLP